MSKPNLLEFLKKHPVLCDGGMGTQLIAAGLAVGEAGERWNAEHPERVRAVHQRYREAGCRLITTNTFSGTRYALARHGLGDRTEELNRAGAATAASVAGEAWILGDVGPFGDFLEPMGDMTAGELEAIFIEQLKALKAGGADGAIVETMVDPAELRVAVMAAKEVSSWPVIATYAFNRGPDGAFRTIMGTTVSQAMHAAIDAGADVVGSNCGTSLSLADYVDLAGELVAAAGETPVILQPNAGSPEMEEGKAVYRATPDQMAAIVPLLLEAGVRIVGGCCGTTPAHLKAMGKRIESR